MINNTLSLAQDEIGIAYSRQLVVNVMTNSCALVLGFFKDSPGITCYHWPGFDNNSSYMEKFITCRGNYPTSITVIVMNPVDAAEQQERDSTLRAFHLFLKGAVPINCYFDTSGRNFISVTLDKGDIDTTPSSIVHFKTLVYSAMS